MRNLWNSEWRPLLMGMVVTCLLAVMAIRSQQVAATYWQPQTVPSPTPQTVPAPLTPDPAEPSPQPGPAAPPQSQGEGLQLLQTVNHTDALPGEEVILKLQAINTSSIAMLGLIVVAPLDPLIQPLAVSGTRGSVERRGNALLIFPGTLETGQSIEISVRVRVSADTPSGRIFVHQFAAYYLNGEAHSNAIGFGLPPLELPPTGNNGRAP